MVGGVSARAANTERRTGSKGGANALVYVHIFLLMMSLPPHLVDKTGGGGGGAPKEMIAEDDSPVRTTSSHCPSFSSSSVGKSQLDAYDLLFVCKQVVFCDSVYSLASSQMLAPGQVD